MSKSGGAGSNTQKLKERCLEKLIGFQDLEYNFLEEGNRETAKPWSICEQECRRCSKVIGVLLAAVSGVFFTLCSVTVKLVKSLDPLNIMLARATVQFVLILPILALVNLDMKAIRANRFYILIHGLVGSLTVLSIFIGFSRLPVGDAATIIFSSPVLVMIASWLLLGEHCGVYRFFVVIVLLSGVLLVAQPPFLLKLLHEEKLIEDVPKLQQVQNRHYDVLGFSAAFLGSLLTAANFVCMKKLNEVHFTILILSFSSVSILLSLVTIPIFSTFRAPEHWTEWIYCVIVGVSGLLGQILLAMALKTETAGLVSVTRSLDIALAYILQITWFAELPEVGSVVGAGLVVTAVIFMTVEEAIILLIRKILGGSGIL